LSRSTILVTGGAGYIGSHTCKALAAKGFEPISYDNLSRGNRWAVKWGPLEEGDLTDATRLSKVLDRYRPAAVLHFAAYAYVGESVENPIAYYENNVGGSTALFREVLRYATIPVVFSSSCATYGIPESVPILEQHPQHPINPYGFTKLVIEQLLADLGRSHALPSLCLRYFNAAGADPSGEIGEAHDPEPHLIPRILMAARNGMPITIYGDDYETPDGTCIRDYIHVSDLADAHVQAVEYLLAGGTSGAFNLANARGFSVLEVVRAAERVTGKTIAIEKVARRPGDPPVLVGSAVRAHDILGWQPVYSDLDSQIAHAWTWMQKRNST
jgi:UDP-arabinose 4-epimerase